VNEPRAELVNAARAGDASAFDDLVLETQQGVYNVALGVLGNAQDAQDAAQDVFLRVWRALPAFRGDSSFGTWLYRVTVNVCLNRRRQYAAGCQQIDGEELVEQLPAPGPDPQSITMRRERDAYLWEMVERLPAQYRLVIVLFYQQQMTYSQIADVLSLPLGTVKAQLNRARQVLARTLTRISETSHAIL